MQMHEGNPDLHPQSLLNLTGDLPQGFSHWSYNYKFSFTSLTP